MEESMLLAMLKDMREDIKAGFTKQEEKSEHLYNEIVSMKLESKDQRNSIDTVHAKIREVEGKVDIVQDEVVKLKAVQDISRAKKFAFDCLDDIRKNAITALMIFVVIFMYLSCSNLKPAFDKSMSVVIQDTSFIRREEK